ncbi:MAG: tRNA (guanine(46)-N(7))-methyltransferase TrmB [Beijerinckiaceae bacterium]|nr:tRNA (guanine(46)-N(7))-methyltransferase TrmB [Beijerinckiaceae bacterium]
MAARSEPHFFGRRKGKSLRPRQAALTENLLPRLRVNAEVLPTLQGASSPPHQDLWLEIGFGGGEHLASDAQSHPDVLFIGCEPFVNGVAKLVSTIDEKKLQNILIHDGDALEILRALPDASLGRVTILYPDPWPKFGQRKRRFISPETIQQMARTLRDGEEVRFATDIDDYSGWTLARFLASESFDWIAREATDWKKPWAGWPSTRYEAKAFREGRTPAYLTFVRKARS